VGNKRVVANRGIPRKLGGKSPSKLNQQLKTKGVSHGQGWLPALRGEVLKDKMGPFFAWRYSERTAQNVLPSCTRLFFFLSRKPVYFLPHPKLEMQNASFNTEPLSIKSMGSTQELEVD